MAIDDVEIRKSKIQGQGLYARRIFEPGEVVLRWDCSQTLTSDQLAQLTKEERRYTHPLDSERTMIVQPPERFVNHSCENNTEVRDFSDVAIRRIEIGEEITSDYGTDGSGVSFDCLCGSDDCRQVIGPDVR
jgi:SET domain-containing protein